MPGMSLLPVREQRHLNFLGLIAFMGSIQKLADALGKSHSQLSQLRNQSVHSTTGKPRVIGDDLAREIEKKLKLPEGWMDHGHLGEAMQMWLMLERGDDNLSPPSDAELLGNFMIPKALGKQALGDPGKRAAENVAPAPIGSRRIPLLDYVQAGAMTQATGTGQADDSTEFLLTDIEVSDAAFAVRIKGNSMEPEFREGDVVIIDPTEAPLPGDFVVAKNGEHEATFKKFRPRGISEGKEVFELVPLNSDYAPLRSDQQHIEIIGTMVEHRKYRRR